MFNTVDLVIEGGGYFKNQRFALHPDRRERRGAFHPIAVFPVWHARTLALALRRSGSAGERGVAAVPVFIWRRP
jgi:hypothetical protein